MPREYGTICAIKRNFDAYFLELVDFIIFFLKFVCITRKMRPKKVTYFLQITFFLSPF